MVEPVLITVAVVTNPLHLWVYSGAGAEELTGSPAWGYGAAFWWHTAYCYLALAVGVGFLAWGVWKPRPASGNSGSPSCSPPSSPAPPTWSTSAVGSASSSTRRRSASLSRAW